MNKPEMKTNLAIDDVFPNQRFISFYSSEQDANNLRPLGTVNKGSRDNKWHLTVDRRFHFDEVLKYIQEQEKLGNKSSPHAGNTVLSFHIDKTRINDTKLVYDLAEGILSLLEVLFGDGFVLLDVSNEIFEVEENGKENG